MSIAIILVVIAACVAGQVFFSSLVKSFATLIAAIIGSFVALNFFEPLALRLVDSGTMAWQAHGLVLGLLFVLTFGILTGIATKALGSDIAFPGLIDKVGGCVIAVLTGIVISGVIIIALGMASSSGTFPYERFSATSPDPKSPSRALLAPDGFVAGLFGLVSDGSLAGENSFAAIHASFNDAIAFGRMAAERKVSPLAGKNAIQGPVLRVAPAGITDSEGKKLPDSPAGTELVLLRLKMSKSVIGKDSADFTLGQLRLICHNKDYRGMSNKGSGTSIYPIGYMKAPTQLHLAPLSSQVPLASVEVDSSGVKEADFAFYLPNGMSAAMIEYKRNLVIPAPQMTDAAAAPAPVGFDKSRQERPSRPAQGNGRDPNSAR